MSSVVIILLIEGPTSLMMSLMDAPPAQVHKCVTLDCGFNMDVIEIALAGRSLAFCRLKCGVSVIGV